MNFNIRNLWSVNIGGAEIWITESLVSVWVVMLVLIAFAVVVRVKLPKFSDKPKGFQNAVEAMVEYFDRFVRTTAGEKLRFLGPWFFTVFAFILISNLSGVIFIGLLRPPTADWGVVFAFALITFILIQIMGVRYQKGQYIRAMFEPYFFSKVPNFLIFPLNLIGELARPVSLSFRLFGNILGGVILMGLVYGMLPLLLRFGLPAFLHAYFDLFAGALQAYVFTVLSLAFIGGAADTT
ncbi:MAG: F0F1 ATP synthase subunit A [Oscillospiraceae bacterium]|nr:F0F1 ATP synthase subunit A [Oscillospiraceae bacterium]